MNVAAPLGLLAAGLAVPLTIWYLLRSRRPRMPVASTFLWERAERSVAAAVPWQRFRGDVTYWLILLALLAGAFALARPFLTVPARLSDHTILVLDASASMLADEDGPTRLELARREVESLVSTMSPGQQVSVIEAGARARVLLSASSDADAVLDASRGVRISHGPANLGDAFTLAAALQRPGQATAVHLMTDGEVPAEWRGDAPPGLQVTAVGAPRPNLAVTRLQAVPVGAGTSQVFVEVRNFGQQESQADLTLVVAGQEVVSERFRLGPRESSDRVLTVQGGDGDVLEARVEPVGQDLAGADRRDALSVDDQAFAILTAPQQVDVVLATPGNVFLESALAAVPAVELTVTASVPVDLTDVDILVVDRLPAPSPPPLPMLVVDATIWPDGVTVGDEVETPTITFQEPSHDLLTDVEYAGVGIAAATPLTAPELIPLVSGPQGDLVMAGRLGGTPVVLFGFDLLASNLPLNATWPVFVANATTWLAGPPATVPALAGSTVTIPFPDGATAVTVAPPSGAERIIDVTTPRLTVDEVGLWRLAFTGAESDAVAAGAPAIAVNPVSSEGDLSRAAPAPPDEDAPGAVAPTTSEGREPIGRTVLIAVLALAVLEWLWVYGLRPLRRSWRARSTPADAVRASGTP